MATSAYGNPLEDLSLEQLRQRGSMKWTTYPPDVLPLWVADMDVRLAPPIASALHQAIDDGDTGYPAGIGLAEAFRGFAARRWRWNDIELDRVVRIPDVMMGAVQVLRLVTEPGDAVVVNTPVYAPYFAFVPNDGRRIVEAPLGEGGRIDLKALSVAFERARACGRNVAYLLCNPHNPTGTVHTTEELIAVAELARRHGVRVVADEIHAPLVLPGATFTPYLTVPGAEDAFSLTSAAKGWNLAGLKAALVVAGSEAARDLRRLPAEVILGSSYLGVIAHTAAFTAGDRWLDSLIAGLAANRDLLSHLIAEHLPGVRFKAPEATYLAWLDCRALGFEVEEKADGIAFASDLAGPAKMFLDQGRVAVSSGHIFGSGGSGHVRVNYATSELVLGEALRRMGRAARSAR